VDDSTGEIATMKACGMIRADRLVGWNYTVQGAVMKFTAIAYAQAVYCSMFKDGAGRGT